MAKDRPDPSAGRRARTVLIVEDEKNQRAMLERAVRQMEFEVAAVESAEQACRILGELRPTLAMLDLNLPGMSGLELAEKIHDQLPKTRTIILTGYGDLDTARQAMRVDVVDFLLKPCPLGELETALGRAYLKACDVAGLPQVEAEAAPPGLAPAAAPPQVSEAPTRLDQVERQLIESALSRHGGQRQPAADELGISVRTLYNRLTRYEAEDRLADTR